MGGSILVLICCCLFGWRFVGKKKNAKEPEDIKSTYKRKRQIKQCIEK